MISARTIAGMASTTAHTTKRSLKWLLSIVRISRDRPSRCSYTSGSTGPFLPFPPCILALIPMGSVGGFHVDARVAWWGGLRYLPHARFSELFLPCGYFVGHMADATRSGGRYGPARFRTRPQECALVG